ncbi:MAG: [protein-PII] uridylyltransferase [Deltaproteobacteria bacterium]|nr:[protein-PII] uridylyltransferase [Deltaproteobacteria bacterium]
MMLKKVQVKQVESEWAGKLPAERSEICARLVSIARWEIAEEIAEDVDESGLQERVRPLLTRMGNLLDHLVKALFEAAIPEATTRIAVVALGSYGRQELFPYSDVDLLIVHQQGSEGMVDRVVKGVVYPLWDAKLAVGHAVRDIDETLDLASEDLTMRTALLDARLVAGDEGPFHALQAGACRELSSPAHLDDFRRLLLDERRERHRRFGQTVFLLEPHIKSGKGGLRDLNTALWAAKARFGVNGLEELAEVEASSSRQQEILTEARDFLQMLRMAAHTHASRTEDRLHFAMQEALAPRLFPGDEIPGERRRVVPAVAPAVERLMHAYYRVARSVVLETEGVLDRCFQPPNAVSPRKLEGCFVSVGGKVDVADVHIFWERPAEIVRAFCIAASEEARLTRRLQDGLAEAAAGEPGAQLLADEEAASLFLQLLLSGPGDEEASRTPLEKMHDLGVLAALIPEFEACTGRVQHDLYHVYTVDHHSLLVLELMRSWLRGVVAASEERAVAVMCSLERPRSLLLAGLLHDVAKPLGSGHAKKGAPLVAGIAARLGLSVEEQREVVFLVREHLRMMHVSQRGDLADPAVIASFAEVVASPRRLDQLYLLSVADSAMTAPGNLSDWKASLLEQLYLRTMESLEVGDQGWSVAQPERRRERVARHIRQERSDVKAELVESLFARLPTELFASLSDDEELSRAINAALDLERSSESIMRLAAQDRDDGTTILTVCGEDVPGFLATITGVMALQNVNVLAADVYTYEAATPNCVARALDIFRVPQSTSSGAWRELSASIQQALCGDFDLDDAVARRIGKVSNLPPRVLPAVETRVRLDNQVTERATVLQLQTADRVGLLHTVTHTLNELALDIVVARVSTEAGRVVDTFYIQERVGSEKVKKGVRWEEISARVFSDVEGLNPAPPLGREEI